VVGIVGIGTVSLPLWLLRLLLPSVLLRFFRALAFLVQGPERVGVVPTTGPSGVLLFVPAAASAAAAAARSCCCREQGQQR